MTRIVKKANACVFSSNLNSDTLIYSEKDGSITINQTKIAETESAKKNVRFYPPDCSVFTTTDAEYGLRIWDTECMKPIYEYRRENLNDHCYSPRCILLSFDEFNLKFYDLRSRFMSNSRPFSNVSKIRWNEYGIFCLAQGNLHILDARNLTQCMTKIEYVHDFAISKNCFYYTSSIENTLYNCSVNDAGKLEKIKKIVPYKTIKTTNNGNCLVGMLKNGLRVESNDAIHDISLGKLEPVDFHVTDEKCFIFTSKELYEIEGGITDLEISDHTYTDTLDD